MNKFFLNLQSSNIDLCTETDSSQRLNKSLLDSPIHAATPNVEPYLHIYDDEDTSDVEMVNDF